MSGTPSKDVASGPSSENRSKSAVRIEPVAVFAREDVQVRDDATLRCEESRVATAAGRQADCLVRHHAVEPTLGVAAGDLHEPASVGASGQRE